MHTRDIRVRPLEARRVERLGCLPGSRIACLCGTAWLTLDGDPRDIVLRAGESFLVDAEAPVMACALGDERAVVAGPQEWGVDPVHVRLHRSVDLSEEALAVAR